MKREHIDDFFEYLNILDTDIKLTMEVEDRKWNTAFSRLFRSWMQGETENRDLQETYKSTNCTKVQFGKPEVHLCEYSILRVQENRGLLHRRIG